MDGSDLLNVDIIVVMVMFDDVNGCMYLVYDNYKVFMYWNCLYYFVISVGYLLDCIGYLVIK